ncbi:hypothetical protein SCG7086_AT_00100 [Chlamydiales bacterium SCGC AG-110-P3]|nr:hypothetical protein SCG7086_AT_00100 [Chlamydiales bacterium SCGC AG-110-P3]
MDRFRFSKNPDLCCKSIYFERPTLRLIRDQLVEYLTRKETRSKDKLMSLLKILKKNRRVGEEGFKQ